MHTCYAFPESKINQSVRFDHTLPCFSRKKIIGNLLKLNRFIINTHELIFLNRK